MHSKKSISELPNRPAVYALMSGTGGRAYVAYVGIAKILKRRISQHLVLRDSSVTTGTSAIMLNPDYVTEVRWWESDEFSNRVYLEAAEIVALEILDPALRSRGITQEAALVLSGKRSFRKAMERLFKGNPSGSLVVPTLLVAPKMSDFDELLGQARRQARKAGLKRSDIARAVKAEKKRK
jgi:hypothetical protein